MECTSFPRHCGTKIVSDFYDCSLPSKLRKTENKTLIGIFIDTTSQKKSYDLMKKRYKILYQSPLLENPLTNRMYFIVIWLNEKP